MSREKKFSLIFILIGVVLIPYSFYVKSFLENKNLGYNFQTKPFYESELYLWIALIWAIFGITYYLFAQIDKIQLETKFIKRHFWFTLPFLMLIIAIPLLDEYTEDSSISESPYFNYIFVYIFVSFILFIVGLISMIYNMIKSTYVYFFFNWKWKK